MSSSEPKCIKCVGIGNSCIKYGKTRSGNQRFYCKSCKKTFVESYKYNAYRRDTNERIKTYIREGVGVLGISRILNISKTTVISRIHRLSKQIVQPIILKNQEYELDELCTYVGNKKNRIWIVYALNRNTKEVVSLAVGKRNNQTLRKVIDTLLLSNAKRIYTDKLKQYKTLIPQATHKVKQYGINHIERMNLTLRTHIKRLNRRTICFSK